MVRCHRKAFVFAVVSPVSHRTEFAGGVHTRNMKTFDVAVTCSC